MPRLRVLVGPNESSLRPITANDNRAYPIKSELFEGTVVVYIKGLVDEHGRQVLPEYFGWKERAGVTWSIQVQGRFLKPCTADDIMFGNTFDRPLKLPWGSSAALKFMRFIDPTLEHDLGSARPWALSPLVSTMPYLAHTPVSSLRRYPEFPAYRPLQDDTSSLHCAHPHSRPLDLGPPNKRRSYFSSEDHRHNVIFGPNDLITTDFCYGFLSFPSLSLNLPGGISFDLMKYWDGQPVRFVCCERPRRPNLSPASSRSGSSSSLKSFGSGSSGSSKSEKKLKGPGRAFWCVVIQVVQDDEVDDDEEPASDVD